MNLILTYLVEASICVGITVLFYRVVLSGLTFFTLNRVLLIGMLMLSFIIPLLSFQIGITSLGTAEITLPEFLVGNPVTRDTSSFTWQEIVFLTYLAGVVIMAVYLMLGYFTSQRMIGKSKLLRYQNYWIAVHPKFIPASFFDYILLPDFDPNRSDQQQIILHESVHVRLKHSWDLLLIQFAKIIFWFNPLIYQFEKSLREVHEYQADRGVTSSYSRKEYSGLLLQLITRGQGWHFMNNFNQFQTKKRIIMMSKPQSQKKELRRFLLAIPVLAAMFFVFSCEIASEEEMEGPMMAGEVKEVQIGPGDISARKLAKDGEPIFDVVEEQPSPPGGMEGWNQYLSQNLTYPAQAKQLGVEGTVIVVFVVNTDGSISDVEILRGIGGGADEEAVRVVENAPNWISGKQKGNPVNTRMRLPIRFKLGGDVQGVGNPQVTPSNDFPETIEVPVRN
ncbi:TonB family C-terminal domain-containing protein [Algoriphagus locisalis]|uniref:TonB family C-terminal domain-containing protein n=1 Tax=Algoriphagus locisalis TaxID=305507 RepID=A0A1I6Y2K4_9BACT|nr:TonB family C-terminal domain-containing protein [Algoriphagus locisalis]